VYKGGELTGKKLIKAKRNSKIGERETSFTKTRIMKNKLFLAITDPLKKIKHLLALIPKPEVLQKIMSCWKRH
jgi:hypothetical protein